MANKQEIAKVEAPQSGELVSMSEMTAMMGQMMHLMQGMAETVRATNERVTALEKQAALSARVTAGQSKHINAAIREQAEKVAAMHGMGSSTTSTQAIARAIRRDVCLTAGVTSTRELPKCEYRVYLQQVALWDDYKVIKAIKAREATK